MTDEQQPSDSVPPVRTTKRPFGGGETTGESLIKRSRRDSNIAENRSQERKPRTLDPAMINERLERPNSKTVEEVRARMASANPSNPTGQYNRPHSLRRTEPMKPVETTQPTAPKWLREAPPLPSDTPPKPRQGPLGSKTNPVVFNSGLDKLDRDFREGSGSNRHNHRRGPPCSVAGSFVDDEHLTSSSWHDRQRHKSRFDSGRHGFLSESRDRLCRSLRSEERLLGKRMREKGHDDRGRSPLSDSPQYDSDNEAEVARLHRDTSFEREMSRRDLTNRCVLRSGSRSTSLSRERNHNRYRRDHLSKLRQQPPRRRNDVLIDHEQDNNRLDPRYPPRNSQPSRRDQGRQGRAVSAREEMIGRLARSRSREKPQTPEQYQNVTEPWPQLEFVDLPPDPHKSLGVDPGKYTEEQELALLNFLIAVYAQRGKVSELMYSVMRLQFELDNKRDALRKRHGREQQDDF